MIHCRVVDFSFGGIGLQIHRRNFDLAVGDTVLVTYERGRHLYHDEYTIIFIAGQHVGAQFKDGGNYSPAQRLIMRSNNGTFRP